MSECLNTCLNMCLNTCLSTCPSVLTLAYPASRHEGVPHLFVRLGAAVRTLPAHKHPLVESVLVEQARTKLRSVEIRL